MSVAAVQRSEPYATRRELAELLQVGVRTIDGWVAEGMPSETWGMARTRRFLPSRCVAWLRERERSRVPSDRVAPQTAPGDKRVEGR